jgi:hypothetical protein
MTQLEALLKSPTAWELKYSSVESDELRPSEAADAVVSLAHLITG